MKHVGALAVVLVLLGAMAMAANPVAQWQTGKILAIKPYDQGRIAFWEGRVPVYDGYAFYDLTVAVAQKKYVVRYESLTGFMPSSWDVGREVKVRVSRGRLYLANGPEEVPMSMVSGIASECVIPAGTPQRLGPQVPCE